GRRPPHRPPPVRPGPPGADGPRRLETRPPARLRPRLVGREHERRRAGGPRAELDQAVRGEQRRGRGPAQRVREPLELRLDRPPRVEAEVRASARGIAGARRRPVAAAPGAELAVEDLADRLLPAPCPPRPPPHAPPSP